MLKLIKESVDHIMEQHFDDESIDDLLNKGLIACKMGFIISTRATLELELEDLVKQAIQKHSDTLELKE